MRLAYQFQGQRSRSSVPLSLTHIVHCIFRTARPTNFKLGIQMEDDNPHQPQSPWPPRSELKVAMSRDQSEPSWPNTVPVSLEAGGAHRVSRTRQQHSLLSDVSVLCRIIWSTAFCVHVARHRAPATGGMVTSISVQPSSCRPTGIYCITVQPDNFHITVTVR